MVFQGSGQLDRMSSLAIIPRLGVKVFFPKDQLARCDSYRLVECGLTVCCATGRRCLNACKANLNNFPVLAILCTAYF